MIRLALWTGLRQGELIALAKQVIDFYRNRLFVVNPKWREDKRKTEGNPMSKQVRDLLLELCRTAQGELIFTDNERARSFGASPRSQPFTGLVPEPRSKTCAFTISAINTARASAMRT